MAKKKVTKKKQSPSRGEATKLFRGGNAPRAAFVRASVEEFRAKEVARLEDRSATERRMAKRLGSARGASEKYDDTRTAAADRARDGLLKEHQRLARRALAAPRVAGDFVGWLPGRIRATIVPPFDYEVVIPTLLAGNEPDLQGDSDRTTGKMSLGAVTATERGFNGGSMYTTVGVYFHPPGRGVLKLYAAPTYSFQWWTNSLRTTDVVRSFGQLGLTIYGIDVASDSIGETGAIKSTAGNQFYSWDENRSGEVNLDFGFDEQAPVLSAELNVDRHLVYMLFVDAHVHVHGVGWPGSLAGSKLSVTVPYLTYDFREQLVVQAF